MANYNLVQEGNRCTLSVFDDDGNIITVPGTVPYFEELFAALRNGDDAVIERLLHPTKEAAETLTELSERVSVAEDRLFFDGDIITGAVADVILRIYGEGPGQKNKLRALVNFLEKVQTNPNEHSREHFYRWAEGAGLTITSEGDVIAYKGVNRDKNGTAVSVSHGTAWVNGVKHTGAIPNRVGDVVTMPRSDVQHDPSVACSTGLHCGTWGYASSFGTGGTLLVKFNPRDVVSVPTDCESQKVRVCRYEVLEVALNKIEDTTYGVCCEDEDDEDYDDEDYDSYEEDYDEEPDEDDDYDDEPDDEEEPIEVTQPRRGWGIIW